MKDISQIIVGYTKQYQDKHWIPCRYRKDLRNCGAWVFENGQYTYKIGYYSKKINGKFVIFCKIDNKPCSAKWTGEKDL